MKVIIPKHKLIDDEIVVCNKPKYVYVPLISGDDTNITVLVNKGEYVFKGGIIGKRKGDFRIPIFSSVSGTVVDFEEKICLTGQKVKCVVIENDFKEKIEQKNKPKEKYTKEEFVELLKETGIIGMGGAGFPTYVKYETKHKIKTLLVNAVECEPYIMADYGLIVNKCEELLEAIDMILEINDIDEAIIAIKRNNMKLKTVFDNYIGTYLKIKIVLVPNHYPMGWERSLIKYVKKIDYDKLPIEQGIIVNNISTIYAIYEALKYNKPLIERVVTFSGEALDKPQNILLKIGSLVSDVIDIKDNTNLIAGGAMMGVKIKGTELVVSPQLNSVLFLKEEECFPSDCLRCGKCVEVCPAKLSPVLIMDSFTSKEKLKKLEVGRCMECGLCSYICPAKILVRECVRKAKLKEGE